MAQCAAVCPTAAITIKNDLREVWQALYAPGKRVVAQIAPAVRVAIGEEFGLPAGKNTIGKIFTALRMLGFDTVFDTSFSADLTVIEEANELLYKLKNGEQKYPLGNSLPLFTSCCPAWVRFVETKYPGTSSVCFYLQIADGNVWCGVERILQTGRRRSRNGDGFCSRYAMCSEKT